MKTFFDFNISDCSWRTCSFLKKLNKNLIETALLLINCHLKAINRQDRYAVLHHGHRATVQSISTGLYLLLNLLLHYHYCDPWQSGLLRRAWEEIKASLSASHPAKHQFSLTQWAETRALNRTGVDQSQAGEWCFCPVLLIKSLRKHYHTIVQARHLVLVRKSM